jgi:hypothetical protein
MRVMDALRLSSHFQVLGHVLFNMSYTTSAFIDVNFINASKNQQYVWSPRCVGQESNAGKNYARHL